MGPLTASGHWPEDMMSCHINLLELEAVFQALSFTILHTDNTTVACYIKKQDGGMGGGGGGGRSRPLSQRTEELLLCCASQSIQLSAQYVPGKLNILADLLSRRPPQSTTRGPEVGMDSRARSAQASLVSLVHTSHRSLCPSVHSSPVRVCVPSARPSSLGGGRAVHSLVKSPVLCHPSPLSPSPIPITGNVLRKARDERATLILVPPHWPTQAWFPELLHLCHVPPPPPPPPPSGFRWALGLFFIPGRGFRTDTEGCCTFTPGFCAGLAVFTRCPLLRGAC